MRPVYRIKEERKAGPELAQEIKSDIESIIENLAEYLEDFVPERKGPSFSKTSVMGPVGKLLSAVSSTKLETKDALIGYVVNVHENTSTKRLSKDGKKSLEEGVENLLLLKEKAPKRFFSKAIREIDYGVYKRKLEYILTRSKDKESGETEKVESEEE